MAYGGIIHFDCPRCKGDIELTAEQCLEPHTFLHQPCGTMLQYDPANTWSPLIILPDKE